MDIRIGPVTDQNLDDCLSLSVSAKQSSFVPDVASSLDLAAKYPDAYPLAITTQGGRVVGFGLYGIDEITGNWKIFRMLIDQRSQGMGYGTAATRLIMDRLSTEHGASEVRIVFHDGNAIAEHVYAQLGFEVYGKDGNKVLAKAPLHTPLSD